MKSSATIKRLPRRWSSRLRPCETCNLHGEPHVQVACRLHYSTSVHSQSLRYFNTMTNTQTSTHSDDRLRPHLHEVSSRRPRQAPAPTVPPANPTTRQPHRARPPPDPRKIAIRRPTPQLSDFRHSRRRSDTDAPATQNPPGPSEELRQPLPAPSAVPAQHVTRYAGQLARHLPRSPRPATPPARHGRPTLPAIDQSLCLSKAPDRRIWTTSIHRRDFATHRSGDRKDHLLRWTTLETRFKTFPVRGTARSTAPGPLDRPPAG